MITNEQIRELRVDLRAAGVFTHHEGRTWLELAVLLTGFAIATALTIAYGFPLAFLTVPLAAVAMTSAVMLGHEGGHSAFSDKRLRNDIMLYLSFPLLGGVSARYWKAKHNVLHHGHPNVVGHDEDLDLWPMAATKAHHEKSGPFLQWFQRNIQGFVFWPLTAFLTWSMRAATFQFLYLGAKKGKMGAGYWVDVAALVLHYIGWILVPGLLVGFLPVILFYVVVWGLIGVFLSAIFVPAHLGLPIVSTYQNGWLLQMQTTRNLRMPGWLSWLFMGLDHQVEHHLFPRIGHHELPRAAVIVKSWADRIGAPYQSIGYVAGLGEVTRLIFRAWDQEASPAEALPRAQPTAVDPSKGAPETPDVFQGRSGQAPA